MWTADPSKRKGENSDLEEFLRLQSLDRIYPGKVVLEVLLRKLARKLWGSPDAIEPVLAVNGLVIFEVAKLHGGGLYHHQDFGRMLLELGLGRFDRLFEFCAGPGYIGYSLFASGFCEKLTLADVNPLAVEAARQTARYNRIEDRVNIFVSDGLDQIPGEEKWDVVVGNPPGFTPKGLKQTSFVEHDPGWALHQRFYSGVKRFMKPGGLVILLEHRFSTGPEIFEPMIREGGGRVVAVRTKTDLRGKKSDRYYMVSEW